MRALARVLFIGGAVAIGLFLFRASPRDVTLVYSLEASEGARPSSLDVRIQRSGETVRRAEFRFPSGAPPAVRHRVRLTDGEYLLRLDLDGAAGARRFERPIVVTESGTIVIPLGS